MPSKASAQKSEKKKKYAMDGVNLLLAQHLIDVDVYRQAQPDTGISEEAMATVTAFMKNCYERIAAGASRPTRFNNKLSASTSREVQASVRAELSDESNKRVVKKRARAVTECSNAQVINNAVKEMKGGKGSSLDAIRTYIKAQYKADAEILAPIASASEASGAGNKSDAKRKASPASGPPAKRAKPSDG